MATSSALVSSSVVTGSPYGGIYVAPGSSPTISGTLFTNNNIGIEVASGQPVVSDNTFTNNSVGLEIASGQPVVSGNTFQSNTIDIRANPGSMAGLGSGNSLTGVSLYGGTITSTTKWPIGGVIYTLTDSVTVGEGVTLTIEPGVEVWFPLWYRVLTVNGTLLADGTPQQPIRFWSSDSNSQGGKIVLSASSSSSVLDNIIIERMSSFRQLQYLKQSTGCGKMG